MRTNTMFLSIESQKCGLIAQCHKLFHFTRNTDNNMIYPCI